MPSTSAAMESFRRSLYLKVLLWFLATLFITGVGLIWITSTFIPDRSPVGGRRIFMLPMILARDAFEQHGPEGLRAELERMRLAVGLEASLTDHTGRDLLTGEDLSEVIARQTRAPKMPGIPPPRGRRAIRSDDGRYWWITQGPPIIPPRPGLVFLPIHLAVLASAGLFAAWLAHHLTKPLRAMRTVVEAFGHGDFSQRVPLDRTDEIGRLGSAFNGMAERIQDLVTAQRRLLMDLSHELRSPLTRLNLVVELARSSSDPQSLANNPAAMKDALDRIEREAARLNDLVGSLLQVARGEADPRHRRRDPVRLDELTASIVEDARIDAQEKGCRIEYSSPGEVTIPGDEELLRRAIENPLRNAVRHSPSDGIIDVSLSRARGAVRVSIRDRGEGVPEESLPRLFDAFYRVQPTGGFGLGLSIARRAVELHDGTIRASNANPGLRVDLEFPAQTSVRNTA